MGTHELKINTIEHNTSKICLHQTWCHSKITLTPKGGKSSNNCLGDMIGGNLVVMNHFGFAKVKRREKMK